MKAPWVLLGLLLVSGCATRTPLPTRDLAGEWARHLARVDQWQAWRLEGRVAVRHAEEGWHAGIRWSHSPGSFELQLSGPLGQGSVWLQGDREGVVLNDGRQRREADDPEQLLERELGWRLPLDGLTDWVKGAPHGEVGARMELDAEGRLARLEQSGWTIRYLKYEAQEGTDLPTRLVLESPQVRLKLIVDQWRRKAPEPGRP